MIFMLYIIGKWLRKIKIIISKKEERLKILKSYWILEDVLLQFVSDWQLYTDRVYCIIDNSDYDVIERSNLVQYNIILCIQCT